MSLKLASGIFRVSSLVESHGACKGSHTLGEYGSVCTSMKVALMLNVP
jgi:hypothetical protein